MERGNFKEYIREELHCFAELMSTEMKQDFKIVKRLMSLEPQLLAIISLLRRQQKNEYDLIVTKLLGNDAVD